MNGARPSPEIGILIPTKNAGPLFRDLLAAIFSQAIDRPFEVVLVDSGSTDETLDIASAYPVRINHIPSTEFGYGRVRNHLAQLSQAPILVNLSQDAVPSSDTWLAQLIAPLEEPDVAASYGRQLPRHDSSPLHAYLLHWWYPSKPERRRIVGREQPRLSTIFYSHVNSAFRRCVWERFPFDEDLVMSEDQGWAITVLSRALDIVYVPEAAVVHSHHYTLRTAFMRNFDSGASLGGMTSDTIFQWFFHGLRYLLGELRFLAASGQAHRIPRACLYEAMGFAGFASGRYHRYLPLELKTRFSKHDLHWRRKAAATSAEGSEQPVIEPVGVSAEERVEGRA